MENDNKFLVWFEYDNPLKNITSKTINKRLIDYITQNTVLSILEFGSKDTDKFILDMYLYYVRVTKYLNRYIKFLTEHTIDISIHLFLKDILSHFKVKDLNYDIIIKSDSFDLLFNKIKLSTYMFFNSILNDFFIIKVIHSTYIENILLTNAAAIVTEKYNRFDRSTTKNIYIYNIPVIQLLALESISNTEIESKIDSIISKKSTYQTVYRGINHLKHKFYRINKTEDQDQYSVIDLKDLFNNTNKAFFEKHLEDLKDDINTQSFKANKLILPKIDYRNFDYVFKFLNDISPEVELSVYFRGLNSIQELFEIKNKLNDFLNENKQIKTSNLVIESDELSYHINQIKKHHEIQDVIIDCEGLIEDIFEINPYEEVSMKIFKKTYLDIFKEIHAHLRYLKVPHSIYSCQLKNKEILRMYRSSGFKNFILYIESWNKITM